MLPIAVLAGQVGGETCLAFPGSGLLNAFDLLDATEESMGSAHKSDCGLNGAPMIARCYKARPLFVRASDLGSLDDKFDVGHGRERRCSREIVVWGRCWEIREKPWRIYTIERELACVAPDRASRAIKIGSAVEKRAFAAAASLKPER